MGAVESTAVLRNHETQIQRLTGDEPISLTDPFWDELLSFSYPLTKLKPSELDELANGWSKTLAENNIKTGHLPKLLVHLGKAIEEPVEQKKVPVKAINAVCFAHLFMKNLAELCDSSSISDFMQLSVSEEEAQALSLASGEIDVPSFVTRSLLRFIAFSDVNAYSYVLHVEVMSLLVVLSSPQLLSPPLLASPQNHLFLDILMAQSDLSGPLVRKLLLSYMARLPLPTRAPLYVQNQGGLGGISGIVGGNSTRSPVNPSVPPSSPRQTPNQTQQGGVLRRVSSAAAAMLWFPYYTYTFLLGGGPLMMGRASPQSPLADHALMLLLLLIHQAPAGEESPGGEGGGEGGEEGGSKGVSPSPSPGSQSTLQALNSNSTPNPFRTALSLVRDEHLGKGTNSSSPAPLLPTQKPSLSVPFAPLFDALTSCLHDERSTLLLYALAHSNPSFLDYVLVRADLDTLILPLLELLYNAPQQSANHLYMLLILLLILSQDASFNANVHKISLSSVPWYRERLLARTPLGSLLVLVLIRTVKYNLSSLRDVYLHTNCLATLANMAPHCHHLTAYASQRLLSLFHMLAKKYTRLTQGQPPPSPVPSQEDGQQGNEASEEHIYTDFLRIVLEIINAILTFSLPRNPEVVYALLHRQEIFVPFKNHPLFYELLENIFTVIDYFNSRMEDVVKTGDLSVEKVLEVILENGRTWRGDNLKMFTELRFTYEEELHPEDFFLPYVWTLIVETSGVPWNKSCVQLYSKGSAENLQDIFDHEAFDSLSEHPSTPKEEV